MKKEKLNDKKVFKLKMLLNDRTFNYYEKLKPILITKEYKRLLNEKIIYTSFSNIIIYVPYLKNEFNKQVIDEFNTNYEFYLKFYLNFLTAKRPTYSPSSYGCYDVNSGDIISAIYEDNKRVILFENWLCSFLMISKEDKEKLIFFPEKNYFYSELKKFIVGTVGYLDI